MRGVQHSRGKRLTQKQKKHMIKIAHELKQDATSKRAAAAARIDAAPEPAVEPAVDVAEPVNVPISHPLNNINVSSHISNRNINIARAANAARAADVELQYVWNPNNNNNNNNIFHPFEKNVTKKDQVIDEAFKDNNSSVVHDTPLPAEPFVDSEAIVPPHPRRPRRRLKFKKNIKTDNNRNNVISIGNTITDNKKFNPFFTGTSDNNYRNAIPFRDKNNLISWNTRIETINSIDNKTRAGNKYKQYLTKVGPKSRTLGPRENILFENDNIDEDLLSEEDKEMREQLRSANLPKNNINKIRRNAVALRGLNRIEYENQKRSPITKRLLSLVGKSKNKTTKRFLNEEMRQKMYNSNKTLRHAILAKNPNFVYQPNRMSNRLTKRAINNADREETRRIYEEEQRKIDMKREEIAKKQRQRENNIKTQKERFKAAKEAAKAEEIERIRAAKAEEIARIKAAKAAEIERIRAAKAAKAADIQRIKGAQAHNEERRKLTLKAENNLWKKRKSNEDRLREAERQELTRALSEKEKIAPGRWTRFKTGFKKIFTKKNNNKK